MQIDQMALHQLFGCLTIALTQRLEQRVMGMFLAKRALPPPVECDNQRRARHQGLQIPGQGEVTGDAGDFDVKQAREMQRPPLIPCGQGHMFNLDEPLQKRDIR